MKKSAKIIKISHKIKIMSEKINQNIKIINKIKIISDKSILKSNKIAIKNPKRAKEKY